MDSRTLETPPMPVDDFVAQLAERLDLPRETTEIQLGELLVAYRDVARARAARPVLARSDLDRAPELVSIAPS